MARWLPAMRCLDPRASRRSLYSAFAVLLWVCALLSGVRRGTAAVSFPNDLLYLTLPENTRGSLVALIPFPGDAVSTNIGYSIVPSAQSVNVRAAALVL